MRDFLEIKRADRDDRLSFKKLSKQIAHSTDGNARHRTKRFRRYAQHSPHSCSSLPDRDSDFHEVVYRPATEARH